MRKAIIYQPLTKKPDYTYPVVNLEPKFLKEEGFTISYDDFYEDVVLPKRTDFSKYEITLKPKYESAYNMLRIPCPNCKGPMSKTYYKWSELLIFKSISTKTMHIALCRKCKNSIKLFPLVQNEYNELILKNEQNILLLFNEVTYTTQNYRDRFFVKDFCLI